MRPLPRSCGGNGEGFLLTQATREATDQDAGNAVVDEPQAMAVTAIFRRSLDVDPVGQLVRAKARKNDTRPRHGPRAPTAVPAARVGRKTDRCEPAKEAEKGLPGTDCKEHAMANRPDENRRPARFPSTRCPRSNWWQRPGLQVRPAPGQGRRSWLACIPIGGWAGKPCGRVLAKNVDKRRNAPTVSGPRPAKRNNENGASDTSAEQFLACCKSRRMSPIGAFVNVDQSIKATVLT